MRKLRREGHLRIIITGSVLANHQDTNDVIFIETATEHKQYTSILEFTIIRIFFPELITGRVPESSLVLLSN
jgi:hypothetical protein